MGVLIRYWREILPILALGLLSIAEPGLARGDDRPRAETPLWVGTGSCAAAACHGGRREPLDLKGSEYSFSQAYDSHSRAYSVLFQDRSKLIERNYRKLNDVESARAFEDDACLRCHVHQGYDSKAAWTRTPEFEVADGVSCEGCHGAAGKWLAPHMEYGFKSLNDQEKLDVFGMKPTKDLLARGQACAECHVGIGASDVNHDLIAAGHPRLNFEYGNQLAKYPKHWRVAEDKARHSDYEAKVWVLGQLLAAKASLDLLESRALRSLPKDSKDPWPEFAEYSCFSCHHEITENRWSAANETRALKPGTLQWGTWYTPLAKSLPSGLAGLDADDSVSSLGQLRSQMARPFMDDDQVAEVAKRARSAADEMGRLADAVNRGRIEPAEVRAMLSRTFQADSSDLALDWDRAAQKYLAIVALSKAASDSDPRYGDVAVKSGLHDLLKDLDLPRPDSERGTLDSPYRFNALKIKGDLNSVQAALPKP
jgi:Cytochrome c554 and c-prime